MSPESVLPVITVVRVTGVGVPPGALHVRLLGPLEVSFGPHPVAVGGPQPRALLSLLALSPGSLLQMPYLVRELWDGDPPAGATNTIQVYVSRLRRALAQPPGPGRPAQQRVQPLQGQQNGYLLELGTTATDVQQFEQLTAQGQAAMDRGDAAAAAQLWQGALDLWRGPALVDLSGPAGQARRAGLEARRLRTLADRLDADARLGRHHDIIPELQELVREHPLDERLTGQLMRALYGAGRQAEALAVYRSTGRLLARELGVDPGPQLRLIHSEVLRQEPSLVSAPRQAPPVPLARRGPARPRTPLIGRAQQQARAADLLATPQIRILTVTGTGGAGKTRLALELAADLAGQLGVPTPVVALDSQTSTADLLPRICQALAATPSWPGQPLIDVIAAALGPGRRVLVLDNLEPLVQAGAGAELAQLLDAIPSLTLLCTSRAPLRLRGEHLLALTGLAVPGPAHEHDPHQVATSAAGQLFIERAQAVMPDFTVSPANAAAIARVCRMLDGLPLAIELAAARVRLLPPHEMLRRVGARLELLTGGADDLPERQRSMRAVLESSVQLLNPDEKRLFAMLSVFSGGWTLADAEAVLDEPGVLDRLERLVDRSLVVADGSGRFAMLGLVREFAAQVLTQLDDDQQNPGISARTRRAHAEHFAGRAAQLAQDVGGNPDSTRSSWPQVEAANLDAALEYATRSDDGQLLAQLMSGLLDHWFYSGRISQADRWVRRADAGRLDPREQAHLRLSAGNLALVAGDLDRAEPMLEQAHTAAVTAGDAELTARTLAARSVVSRHRGDALRALALVDDALQAAGTAGSWALTVRLGNERGELLDETGRPDLARPLFESFRAWSATEQAPSNLAIAVMNLACLAADQGHEPAARELVGAAISAVTAGGSAPLRGDVLAAAGGVHLILGDPVPAGRYLREAAPLMFAAGQLLTLPDTIALLSVSALHTGHPRTAARLLGVSQAWRAVHGLAMASRRTRRLLATAHDGIGAALGDPDELQRELARGASAPYGALPQVAQVAGWDRIWLADLRGTALAGPEVQRVTGSLSAKAISSSGRSPAGSKPNTLP
jgi:predicted ATPase/DNA-binding SARP family transcriptional activator